MQPASTSAEMLQCYQFIGVLMAISLLQKETVLGIDLCSVVWKQLVQQAAEGADLAAFDESCASPALYLTAQKPHSCARARVDPSRRFRGRDRRLSRELPLAGSARVL